MCLIARTTHARTTHIRSAPSAHTALAPADRLQASEIEQTIPTIGFNVETLQYKNIKFQVWDLGGQTSIRPYWRCYYPNTDALIFVVDSADHDRLKIAKQELFAMLEVRPSFPAQQRCATCCVASLPTFASASHHLTQPPVPTTPAARISGLLSVLTSNPPGGGAEGRHFACVREQARPGGRVQCGANYRGHGSFQH